MRSDARGPRARARGLGVVVMLTSLLLGPAGCDRRAPRAPYRFEPEAKAIPVPAGLAARDPRLAIDRATGSGGTVYALAVLGDEQVSRVGLLVSDDGGDRFGAPAWASGEAARVESHGENAPAIEADGQTAIHVVWEQLTGSHVDVMVGRSQDFGGSFAAPVRVTDTDPAAEVYAGYTALAVRNADVYVAWLDFREHTPDMSASVYVAHSADGGATFGPNVRVARAVCSCCHPALAILPSGEVLLFWRHVFPDGTHDAAVARSSDAGQHFSEPQRVAFDGWKIDGCPDSGPVTAIRDRRVYVAWLTEASPEVAGVRLTWSDDGGRTFAPAVVASRGVADGNYPSMAVTPEGRVVLAFQGRDPDEASGWGPIQPYLVEIERDGRVGAPTPVRLDLSRTSVLRPRVAAATVGRVYLSWTDLSGATPRAMWIRGRRTAP